MRKRIFLSLLGAAVLFAWGFAGHVVIRLYDPVYNGFVDESEVAAALAANASTAGIYYLPLRPVRGDRPQSEAFINFVPAGERSAFGVMAARGIAVNAITVFLVLTLLSGLRMDAYWTGVGRFALTGLVLSFATHAYFWNWFDFPGAFLALSVTDAVVGWTLTGLVLTRFLAGRREGLAPLNG